MPSIHFKCVDRLNLHRVSDDEYESGNWVVAPADAQRLIGGMIYLHNTKSERSYFGGKIKSARPVRTNDRIPDRIVFRFVPLSEARGIRWRGIDHINAHQSGVVED
ncbi:hypothetical protein HJC22_28635 [Corallococcus exiguus]|uniref:hypothetical protein n=1 Tax=Corallococcus TaxID=83461 RepID=UPI000EEE70DF|nr:MULTISPECIES: hypothetical protein [Corallococcus]NNC19691.1 hypothetical protein [Corallococcus exiguus]RKI13432.1 hypothetical protein D7Y15_16735 [Corallococcus sp. AB030]